MNRSRVRGLVAGCRVAVVALGLLVHARSASAQTASPDGAAFAEHLRAAVTAGPVAWDRLWAPGARTPERRVLDARTRALFDWFDVEVKPERVVDLGARGIATEVTLRGTATWRDEAWGVASSFWTLQLDERFPSNHVVRRERWIHAHDGGATAREMLPLLEVEEARIGVGVYPGQNAVLLDCTYYVRSLVEGVRYVRFLLDRRVQIYDLRVNGELTDLVRGSELGSLGLEGFSPEIESSLELPRALGRGEQALLKFRMRSPLVHMTGPGFVTTLPIREGAFRERVWLPLFDGHAESRETDVQLTITWPQDGFSELALCAQGGKVAETDTDAKLEERSVHLRVAGHLADLDFTLLDPGATLADLPGPARAVVTLAPESFGEPGVTRLRRSPPGAVTRRRAALIEPLLDVSQTSSRDLSSELQDLIPLDDDVLDELFDDSSQDAERGADDRQAG